MVSALADCWAREGQRLRPHLIEVAHAAGNAEGNRHDQLDFLAGLLHDAGKARPSWQNYLARSLQNEKAETVPHAYIGAALFALYGQALLDDEPKTVQHYLLLVQDLADHHGKLRDRIKSPIDVIVPWRESMRRFPPQDAFYGDLDALVHRFFPELTLSLPSYEAFQKHLQQLEAGWQRQVHLQGMKLKQATKGSAAAYALWTCRDATGRLIAADRLSASAPTSRQATLTPELAREALETFKDVLAQIYRKAVAKGHGAMADKRRRVHEQVRERYLKSPQAPWFALNLPVGWGKTLSSLRIALESAAAGQTARIIYVAPYLAILTQAAKELREATGLEVLEHHHLALLSEVSEQREPVDILTMESWRAPIVATTFNQLFRAIFPATAQQSIRIPALERAFILIDEPQVMNAEVYNAFLRGLDALRECLGAQVMLITATLPPTGYGLSQAPLDLTPPIESADRYVLIAHAEPWTEAQLVERVLERFGERQQVAIILNTIADAVTTYQRLREALPDADRASCFNLHGMMTPLHKAYLIAQVSKRLKMGKPVLVVSTQVLEAGIDLSFRCVLRARPILSSVAQAAGRGNRHAEGDVAAIEVFDLLRDSGKDARKIIYRNEQQRRVTDELLGAGQWSEAETTRLIANYFNKLNVVDANLAVLERFKRAAEGEWQALAGLSPFDALDDDDGSEFRTELSASVFVATSERWLPESIRAWMKHFGVQQLHEVYERYRDKRGLAQLDFSERKRLIGLVRQFVAPLRWRLVPQVCGRVDLEKQGILRALDDSAYHLDTGFGHLLSRTDFDAFELRLEARMSREHHEDFL